MYANAFRLALAYAVKYESTAGEDVALLYDRDRLVAVQRAPEVKSAETHVALPIVRMLRRQGKRFSSRNTYIYTTAVPTEACIGMARLCGVSAIVCQSGGKVYECATRRDGISWSSYVPSSEGDWPNVTIQSGKGVVTVNWYTNPATNSASLKSWAKWLATRKFYGAKDAWHALNTTIDGPAPGAPAFAETGFEDLPLRTYFKDHKVLDNVMMMLAFEVIAAVHGGYSANTNRSETYFGQNIGSLLADADGAIVGWGVNTNWSNATRHGETNLILSYYGSNTKLPAGGTLYTTLEPCEMCAGLIVRGVRAGDSFRVIYGMADPNVSHTALGTKGTGSIVMSPSDAKIAPAKLIHSGTATGAKTAWPAALKSAHEGSGSAEVTRFVEETTTRQNYFDLARPNWWLYLWDAEMTALGGLTHSSDLKKIRPEVETAYQKLESMYQLVEAFMRTVRGQALTV